MNNHYEYMKEQGLRKRPSDSVMGPDVGPRLKRRNDRKKLVARKQEDYAAGRPRFPKFKYPKAERITRKIRDHSGVVGINPVKNIAGSLNKIARGGPKNQLTARDYAASALEGVGLGARSGASLARVAGNKIRR